MFFRILGMDGRYAIIRSTDLPCSLWHSAWVDKPEEMVGKKVAVITNLKPCKLCGVESQGMILAAGDDEGNLSVVTVDKDIVSGSEIC